MIDPAEGELLRVTVQGASCPQPAEELHAAERVAGLVNLDVDALARADRFGGRQMYYHAVLLPDEVDCAEPTGCFLGAQQCVLCEGQCCSLLELGDVGEVPHADELHQETVTNPELREVKIKIFSSEIRTWNYNYLTGINR